MWKLGFVILLSCLINVIAPATSVRAHGGHHHHHDHDHDHDHHHDYAKELYENFHQLVALFQEYLHDVAGSPQSDIAYIDGGRLGRPQDRIPVSVSAMNQLLSVAVMGQVDDRSMLADPTPFWQWLARKTNGVVVGVPVALVEMVGRALAHPIKTGQSIYISMETAAVRYSFQYTLAIAVYILISQTAWESVESVVSPLGHVACTVFNTALLATAVPMQRILDMTNSALCYASSKLPWYKRLHLAATGYMNDLNYKLANLRKVLLPMPRGTLRVGAAAFAKDIDAASLAHFLRSKGLVAPLLGMAPENMQVPLAGLLQDLDVIFAGQDSNVKRAFVQRTHIAGLAIPAAMLQEVIWTLRAEGRMARGVHLAFEKVVARLSRSLSLYEARTLFISAQQDIDTNSEWRRNYENVVEKFIDLYGAVGASLDPLLRNEGEVPDGSEAGLVHQLSSTSPELKVLTEMSRDLYRSVSELHNGAPIQAREQVAESASLCENAIAE